MAYKTLTRNQHFKTVGPKRILALDGGGLRGIVTLAYLKRIEDLVSADIFTDFLEMAEYLLKNGYKDPATSLIGAVLEDGLRRVSAGHGIKLKSREDIQSLNTKLAAAVELYGQQRTQPDQKQSSRA